MQRRFHANHSLKSKRRHSNFTKKTVKHDESKVSKISNKRKGFKKKTIKTNKVLRRLEITRFIEECLQTCCIIIGAQ